MAFIRVLGAWVFIFALLCNPGNCADSEEDMFSGDVLSSGGSDILWLWGEVTAVDAQKRQLSVKYLDYDMDAEKEAVIKADDKTTYENANSFADIKVSDTVSVDYVTGPDGAYLARHISVERPQDMPEEPPAR